MCLSMSELQGYQVLGRTRPHRRDNLLFAEAVFELWSALLNILYLHHIALLMNLFSAGIKTRELLEGVGAVWLTQLCSQVFHVWQYPLPCVLSCQLLWSGAGPALLLASIVPPAAPVHSDTRLPWRPGCPGLACCREVTHFCQVEKIRIVRQHQASSSQCDSKRLKLKCKTGI